MSDMVEKRKRTGSGRRRKRIRGKKQRRQQILLRTLPVIMLAAAVLLLLSFAAEKRKGRALQAETVDSGIAEAEGDIDWFGAPEIDVELLTVNPYSRPGIALKAVKGIVVHYTANPGSSAMANRNYFENLKESQDRKVSSHFVVGLDGEIIQCIPTKEIAYASNDRNTDTLSIECCHPDETGEFTEDTYDSLVQLTAWLCKRFSLDRDDVIRHFDVTEKNCPRYFVEHEDAWEQFKEAVQTRKKEIISAENGKKS